MSAEAGNTIWCWGKNGRKKPSGFCWALASGIRWLSPALEKSGRCAPSTRSPAIGKIAGRIWFWRARNESIPAQPGLRPAHHGTGPSHGGLLEERDIGHHDRGEDREA